MDVPGVLDDERSRAEVFQELPFHYVEIAHILLTQSKDTFGDSLHQVKRAALLECLLCALLSQAAQVQDLVESVRKVRFTKVDSGLRILSGPMTVKLNNLSAMECNLIRPFFAGALDRFYQLSKVSAEVCGCLRPPSLSRADLPEHVVPCRQAHPMTEGS